ncbi:MAG: hypothetical protein ACI35S_01045 [Anaeroplasma sp.]
MEIDNTQTLSIEELKEIIKGYFNGLISQIRIAKTKDEMIEKLRKELQKYREGFAYSLVKNIGLELISFVEDAKRTVADIEKYATNEEKVKKYLDYIIGDLEEIIDNIGLSIADDDLMIDEKKVTDLVPFKYQSNESLEEVSNEDAQDEKETDNKEIASEKGMDEDKTLDIVSMLLNLFEENKVEVEKILRENEVLDKNLAEFEKIASTIDKNYADYYMLPNYKRMDLFYKKLKTNISEKISTLTADNMKESYLEVLDFVINNVEEILLFFGIKTIKLISDDFEKTVDKILKVIPTPIQDLDKKIAKRYSDCYEFEGKVIYPSKVDVYKFSN